jgi:hypothetical protein
MLVKRTALAMTHRKSPISSVIPAPPEPYSPQSYRHQRTPTREHLADPSGAVGLPRESEMPKRGQCCGDSSQEPKRSTPDWCRRFEGPEASWTICQPGHLTRPLERKRQGIVRRLLREGSTDQQQRRRSYAVTAASIINVTICAQLNGLSAEYVERSHSLSPSQVNSEWLGPAYADPPLILSVVVHGRRRSPPTQFDHPARCLRSASLAVGSARDARTAGVPLGSHLRRYG